MKPEPMKMTVCTVAIDLVLTGSALAERLEYACAPATVVWQSPSPNIHPSIQSHPFKIVFDDVTGWERTVEAASDNDVAMFDTSYGARMAWHGYRKTDRYETFTGWFQQGNAGDTTTYVERISYYGNSILQTQAQCSLVVPPTPVVASEPPPQNSAPAADVIALYPGYGGRALYAYIDIGPWPQRVLIDTGATSLTVTEPLAQRLLAQGFADEGPRVAVTMADGSEREGRTIIVDRVTIGGHVLHSVRAGVTPDRADMLLGLPLLTQIGRFTIDSANHKLIFG
jgi:clan AA aspartic protease (TIGR02281 family)